MAVSILNHKKLLLPLVLCTCTIRWPAEQDFTSARRTNLQVFIRLTIIVRFKWYIIRRSKDPHLNDIFYQVYNEYPLSFNYGGVYVSIQLVSLVCQAWMRCECWIMAMATIWLLVGNLGLTFSTRQFCRISAISYSLQEFSILIPLEFTITSPATQPPKVRFLLILAKMFTNSRS